MTFPGITGLQASQAGPAFVRPLGQAVTLHPGVTPLLPVRGEVHTMEQPLCLYFQTPGRQRRVAQHLICGDNLAPSMLGFHGSMLPAQSRAELTQRFAATLAEVIPALLQPAQPGWEAVTHKRLPTSHLPLRSCFFKP